MDDRNEIAGWLVIGAALFGGKATELQRLLACDDFATTEQQDLWRELSRGEQPAKRWLHKRGVMESVKEDLIGQLTDMLKRLPTARGSDVAEQALLGSIMRSKDAALQIVRQLEASDFRGWANRQVFAACKAVLNARGVPDMANVAQELDKSGVLSEVRVEYLPELFEVGNTCGDWPRHIRIVKESASFRRMELFGLRLAKACRESREPAAELRDKAMGWLRNGSK